MDVLESSWDKLKGSGIVFLFALVALTLALWFVIARYATLAYREVRQIVIEAMESR